MELFVFGLFDYRLILVLEGGVGSHLQVDRDAIVGCNNNILLLDGLVKFLQEIGCCNLNQIGDLVSTSIWG
jgi:hypothetical protein